MTLFTSLPYQAESGPEPSPRRWFPDLYLRPDEYFKSVLSSGQTFPFLVMWPCGIATILDRAQMASVLGRPAVLRGLLGSWFALWTAAIIMGALSGILVWFIGGWWFRMRLRFSGARNADPLSARLVYIHAFSSGAIPSIVRVLILVPRYSSVYQALSDDSFILTSLVLPFWSIYLAYRGAVGSFEVRRTPARIWFLILPWGLLSLFLILIFTSGLASIWGAF